MSKKKTKISVWKKHPELLDLLYQFYPVYGSKVWDKIPQFQREGVSIEAISKKAERLRIRFDPLIGAANDEEENEKFYIGKQFFCRYGHSVEPRTGRCMEGYHPAFIDLSTAKVGIFDIESSNLKADWGYVFCWCIKTLGKNEFITGRIVKEDLEKGIFDKNIMKQLVSALRKYDLIITYYGNGFDFPFVRSRCLHHNIAFPAVGTLLSWDMYPVAKNKLCLSRNRLEHVAEFLGIKGKTHIYPEIWSKALFGDKKSLDYIADHNMRDTIVLEKVRNRLEGQWKVQRISI